MEGRRWSSFEVELEIADDKESLEALHEWAGQKVSQVSEVSPSQRNVHRGRQRCPHAARAARVEHGGVKEYSVLTLSIFIHHQRMDFIEVRHCAYERHAKTSSRRLAAVLCYECIERS